MFYESLLLLGILLLVFVLPLTLLSSTMETAPPGAILWLYLFFVLGAYFVWHWHCGQTLPMRTWKLRIDVPNGGRPTPRQLALRYCLAWPSVGLFGLGLLWALVDRDRQFLHDRLAGTCVVFV